MMLAEFISNWHSLEHFFRTTEPVRNGEWPNWRERGFSYDNSCMLRLDYSTTDTDDDTNIRDAFKYWLTDLMDLLENGDVNNGADALYKAFDGIKKRNRLPYEAGVSSATLFREVRKSGVHDYTLFIRYKTVWSKYTKELDINFENDNA